ncbi:hypothetical protein RDWZM_009440 [Blomia tropicalis]|uniref:AB hydrolase-1 domain-containing protein n=1 Tax=Blomia tropicalis TaxID=40697 RepID=A0A9Q0M1E7_BLOTA|nr:1-acylglycerol-3-phosphate O-acyltransferase abhd5 [Blomia tropicalis]KAJ6218283.1 hypothetical protein RDWZM_009440 [Blomia tropicalis]
MYRWRPTSPEELDKVESDILKHVKSPIKKYYVDIGQGWNLDHVHIWTLEIPAKTENCQKLPIVLVHGFASAVALWSLNLDKLSCNGERTIYAFDMIGFGKSSRPKFDYPKSTSKSSKEEALYNCELSESYFVECIEKWRNKIGKPLDGKFILLGHSLGGYITTAYSLKYPKNVAHLILADPFGFPPDNQSKERSKNGKLTSAKQYPFIAKLFTKLIFDLVTPLAPLRAMGPWGPKVIYKTRSDIRKKFAQLQQHSTSSEGVDNGEQTGATKPNRTITDYIYHCNAQLPPSGEIAFQKLLHSTGWPRKPMLERIGELGKHITIDFIYGSVSWIDWETGEKVKRQLSPNGERVKVHVIEGAGHHVYADKPNEFNQLILDIVSGVETQTFIGK